MKKRTAHLTLLALLVVSLTALSRGGWAVITVDDLPDHLVAGQPLTLTYAVRQHGRTLLPGLSGRVTATSAKGGTPANANATAAGGDGRYSASLVIPEPGEWTVSIHSGFMNSISTLLPMQVVARGAPAPAPLADFERGRRLFAAKGCQECHVHQLVNASRKTDIGPDLTTLRFEPEYLARYLANPAIKPPTRPNQMPTLGLSAREIVSLTSFINSERRITAK